MTFLFWTMGVGAPILTAILVLMIASIVMNTNIHAINLPWVLVMALAAVWFFGMTIKYYGLGPEIVCDYLASIGLPAVSVMFVLMIVGNLLDGRFTSGKMDVDEYMLNNLRVSAIGSFLVCLLYEWIMGSINSQIGVDYYYVSGKLYPGKFDIVDVVLYALGAGMIGISAHVALRQIRADINEQEDDA